MCPDCLREYEDPLDRRFHAQPNACPVCGPSLELVAPRNAVTEASELVLGRSYLRMPRDIAEAGEAARTRWLLKHGAIVGVRGLGGFHIAANAELVSTIRALREKKNRPAKPFAIMCRSLDVARQLVRRLGEAGVPAAAAPADWLPEPLDVVRLRGLLPPLLTYCAPMVLPSAFLTAVIMTFGRLSADNELTAVRAAGVHTFSIIWPVLACAVALSVAAAYLQFELVPRARGAVQALRYQALQQILLDRAALSARREFSFKPVFIRYDGYRDGKLTGLLLLLVVFTLIYMLKRRPDHPFRDSRFVFFIFILIPVQTLFAHNWLTLPYYINRAFGGSWVGDSFEFFSNINPLLIFFLTPVVAALTARFRVYKMMVAGTFVMAAPTFLLAIGPNPVLLLVYILLMSVGEAMWQPRFLQWVAEIAPKGKAGAYMGIAQFPWFLTKVITGLYSGYFLARYCPMVGPQNTELLWLVYGFVAMASPLALWLAKGWMEKGENL